jgi:hypothetical protein
MFQAIRYRLLISYLTVLTVILGVFAIAIRISFARNLKQELVERLAILAKSTGDELDLEGEQLSVDVDAEDVFIGPN